ncbi:MAG: hypothetical protein R3E79_46535 [Caldilineaceae bacterium]
MSTTTTTAKGQMGAWRASLSRRGLLRGLAATAGMAVLGQGGCTVAQIPGIFESGTDLSAWTMTLGDGLYAAPGEAPVGQDDIETIHHTTHSELRANLQRRQIMVHNLMYKKVIDPTVVDYVHFCSYEFRLPFLPTKGNREENAQTLEGGFSLWDGGTTRINFNTAFQWVLNPYRDAGTVRVWTTVDKGSWQPAGVLPVDTEWHRVLFMINYQAQTGSLAIDGVPYLTTPSTNRGPDRWGRDMSATLAAEIISIFPGGGAYGALHRAEVRNWRWAWLPNDQARTFLPCIEQV